MKSINPIASIALLFLASPAFADELLVCDRVGQGTGSRSLAIEISEETISTTDLERTGAKPRIWKRDDPGLYSFWGTDSSYVRGTNEKYVYYVRFDIEGRKSLSSIRPKKYFEMEITFAWESLYFDTYGTLSRDLYSCKKL